MNRSLLVVCSCSLLAWSWLASGCGKSGAQEASTATYSVVDSSGTVLGPLVGSSPAWNLFTSQANVNGMGVVTSVQLVPTGQYYTFLDPARRLWSVNGSGTIIQLEPAIAYLTDDCSGDAFVRWGNPALVMFYGGSFKTVTGAPASVVPARLNQPRSPPGMCSPYAGAALLLWPVSTLSSVAAPTSVPPVTIR
jgi:hypothetical protein